MSNAHASVDDIVCTPFAFAAASLVTCPMPEANSSILSYICTFMLRIIWSKAHPITLDLVTSFAAATPRPDPCSCTHLGWQPYIFTSIAAGSSLLLCPMLHANSSFNDMIVASFTAESFPLLCPCLIHTPALTTR
jgi:hypothetical protein